MPHPLFVFVSSDTRREVCFRLVDTVLFSRTEEIPVLTADPEDTILQTG